MKGLRLGVTFIFVLVIFLLGVFQMQLRGYEKIGRIEEWTVYYNEDHCDEDVVLVYNNSEGSYEFDCVNSETYIVKRGFEEYSLLEALNSEYIEINDLENLIDYTILPDE